MSNNNENTYSAKELNSMTNEELARLGTQLDDVTVAYRKERFPISGDPADKRASRAVGIWLGIGIVAAIGFLLVYLAWPWNYRGALHRPAPAAKLQSGAMSRSARR